MYLCEASGANMVTVMVVGHGDSFIVDMKHLPREGDYLGHYHGALVKVLQVILEPWEGNTRKIANLDPWDYSSYELSRIDAIVIVDAPIPVDENKGVLLG